MIWKRTSAVGGVLIAIMATVETARAQNSSGEDLGTLVFTANRRETELRFAPASVTVVTQKEIEHRGGSSIAELLRDVPGVRS